MHTPSSSPTRGRRRVLWLASAAALAGGVATVATGAELLTNGSFETGATAGSDHLAGWTLVRQAASLGGFYAQSGTVSPRAHFVLPAPPDGSFAAASDQMGPSSQVLYQDVTLPAGETATLSLRWALANQAGTFASPATLDYATTTPNQQARIDIMDPAAPALDVGAGVLRNLLQTQPGDPAEVAYTALTADLSPWAGRTVRLRIAQADNLHGLNFAVDQVSVKTSSTPAGTLTPTSYTAVPATAPAGSSGTVALQIAGNGGGATACQFVSAQYLTAAAIATAPIDVNFPYGGVRFVLENCTLNAKVQVRMVFPAALPADAVYWKFGPTLANPAPHWYSLPTTVSGNTATFELQDGGVGDDDLLANGRIVDPGGIGTKAAPPTLPATSVAPVPTLSTAALALLTLVLGAASAFGQRSRLSRRSAAHRGLR